VPVITKTPFPNPSGVPITANQNFYTVTYLEQEPVEPEDWSLTIDGNVETPLTLSLADIQQMPAVVEMRTLCCISNPPGGPLIGNAVWKGVRFRDVLERAGVKADTLELYLIGDDGYDTSIPLELGQDPDSLLVYEMNGEPLPLEHGKPLRCLFPGRYGMKQPKWIVKITATTEPHKGYWVVQGWSNEALIQPFSRIDVPDELATITSPTLTIQGIGFSDASGIKTIEVSTDDGATWLQPELVRGPTPLVWTSFEWQGTTPPNGEHILLSRTTDNSGAQQSRDEGSMFSSTFPDGTEAIQPVPIRVNQ
jgi:DMSO/TMAO reductase YedYZ molybdopterin-dependent catalytic subunit